MDSLFLTNPTNFSSRRLLCPKRSSQKEARSACRLLTRSPRCTMGIALGGSNNYENVLKFPRMHVWDPYKLLGLSRDASEEEILAARNFLLEQYAGHEGSIESIEGAFEKLLMASFRLRKKTKINIKSKLKKQVEESPPWVQRLLTYVEVPPVDTILRRLFLFVFMGGWSIMNSAETGPAFQVALSLGSCIYFLNDKMNSVPRAAITGFVALAVGWIVGSTVVPTIPSVLLQPTWSLELLTSLVSYVFLFLACTFLKNKEDVMNKHCVPINAPNFHTSNLMYAEDFFLGDVDDGTVVPLKTSLIPLPDILGLCARYIGTLCKF